MSDTRKRGVSWTIHTNLDGTTPHADAALAVMMDIRDELQTLNAVLRCPNFQRIPRYLRTIASRKRRSSGRGSKRTARGGRS